MGVRAVLITGAGSRVGRALVAALAGDGHHVCAADSDSDVVQALVDGAGPGVVLGVAGHGHDPDHQDDAVDYALAAFERIDGLVNVVATGGAAPRAGGRGVPSGWIYRVQLAWMAERGGSITNVYPVDGPSAETVGALVSVATREIAARLGPRTRVTSIVVPVAVGASSGPAGRVDPGSGERVVPGSGLRVVPATGPADRLAGLVLRLLAADTSEFTGRTLLARATGGWSAVDGDPVPD
ncbi:SDR family NAD(P)-dependent oxidoreductase [Cryptosporangium sp. NPDC051539]|uniref:SDR family NAD(P)-dependent oxidoreductase n=1 Tax=Cryptosporangium sp. NPDC051539 TaxID=3363962 RepID=UPI00378F315A